MRPPPAPPPGPPAPAAQGRTAWRCAVRAAALAWVGACALFVVRFTPWMLRRREPAGG